MKYLDIIEENFTKADYIAYLRGMVLKSLLQDKPFDAMEFKLYANKLVEILREQQAEKSSVDIDISRPVVESTEETPKESTVNPDEPKVQPKHEFKLGDHVILYKGEEDECTGVIVRLPMDGVDCSSSYVVDLDDKDLGWIAKVDVDGVDCRNAWAVSAKRMELIVDTIEKNTTLQKNKWYHTTDFTVEELQKLLPIGTHLQVEKQVLYDNIATTPPKETRPCIVKNIVTSAFGDTTLIEGVDDGFLREWFKITEEDL